MNAMQEDIIRRMVANMGNGTDDAPKQPLSIQARNLKDMLTERERPNPFRIGDLIVQRKNASRYKWPEPGVELAMVTDVADPGSFFSSRSDHTHSAEDLIVLCLVEGQWVEFSVESWRFDRYEGEVDAS